VLGEVGEGELPAEAADAIEDDGGALATVDGDDLALDVVEERAPADETADDLDVVVDLGNLLGIGDDTVGLVENLANLEDLLVGDADEGGGLAVVDVAGGVGDALGDEGTLLHDLHTVGLVDTDEELAMDDDLLLTGGDRGAGLAAHTALDGDVGLDGEAKVSAVEEVAALELLQALHPIDVPGGGVEGTLLDDGHAKPDTTVLDALQLAKYPLVLRHASGARPLCSRLGLDARR